MGLKKGGCLALAMAAAAGFALPGWTEPPAPADSAIAQAQGRESGILSDRERIYKNRQDFRQLKLVDSVWWIKIRAIKRPEEPLAPLEQDRIRRKQTLMKAFCQEARFRKRNEVDSLADMSAAERAYCKERLLILNPLLP